MKLNTINLLIIFAACSPTSHDTKFATKTKSAEVKKELKDPKNSAVSLNSKQPKLAPASQGSKLVVPTFEITLDKSDFVQVLRCKANYELITSTGQKFENLDSTADVERFKWMWNRAQGDYNSCKSVGLRITRPSINDMAAPSGKYYYLVNPCVLASNSITQREECSFKLAKTDSIAWESTLDSNFIEVSEKVNAMESDIASDVNDMINFAKMVADTQESCEEYWASKEANKARLRGFLSLASMAVGGVVGGLMTGGLGAIQGAQTFLGFARGIFGLTMNTSIPNCDQAEKYRQKATLVFSRLEPKIANMIEARKSLASLNSDYATLNDQIKANVPDASK